MDILILDIGCSNTKAFVYRCAGESVSLEYERIVETYLSVDAIYETCLDLVSTVIADGFSLSAILPTTFSDSVVAETYDNFWVLRHPFSDANRNRNTAGYATTGYSHIFPNLAQRVVDLREAGYRLRRILPVSGYIAARLVGNRAWQAWDFTHASNSGMWNQRRQLWLPQIGDLCVDAPLLEHFCVSPARIVGTLDTMVPVMVGGHDTLFIPSNDLCAYISTGTWTTCSLPQNNFAPDASESANVRWLRDPSQHFHKQLLMQTPTELHPPYFDRIRSFMRQASHSVVTGPFAETVVDALGDTKGAYEIRKNAQHEEAAKFAVRHL